MRVGSGQAAGGSLGSVHKKCSSSATLMKIDNPKHKPVVEQFVTTSPGNVIATTAIANVLFQVAAQASWHTVNNKVFTHTWKKRKSCRQRRAMAASGGAQTWWKRSSCRQRLCRPMLPMVRAASIHAAALPTAGCC